jgi:hypothetical protein
MEPKFQPVMLLLSGDLGISVKIWSQGAKFGYVSQKFLRESKILPFHPHTCPLLWMWCWG